MTHPSDGELLKKLEADLEIANSRENTAPEKFGVLLRFLKTAPVRPLGSERAAKWSVEELAAEFAVVTQAIEHWLAGRKTPKTDAKLQQVFLGKESKRENKDRKKIRLYIREIWKAARTSQLEKARTKRATKKPSESPGAERARIDVARRLNELPDVIYGRGQECDQLDRFLENNKRGVVILTGPAGAGKSAFMASWLRHRQRAGDLIVRHFVWREFSGTTNVLEMLQHLLFQLAEHGFDVNLNEALNRMAIRLALNDLVRALKRRSARRLIIAVDAIDELDDRLSGHFVTNELAENIFVVVSCRANKDEEPPRLRPWLELRRIGMVTASMTLGGLNQIDIEKWYADSVDPERPTDVTETRASIAKLQRVTEGLPLLLQHVLTDERLLTRDADMQSVISQMPSSFSEYLKQEFERLVEELGREWTRPVRLMFALLTKLHAPISTVEVRAFVLHALRQEGHLSEIPELNYVDDKLRRWLSIQTINERTCFSLTHPRFQDTFAEIMKLECADVERCLIPWLELAWRSAGEVGSKNVSFYALDWLPEHLIAGNRDNQRRATYLLSSPTFLKAQVLDPKYSSWRLRGVIDAWNDWDLPGRKDVRGAQQWTAFWAQNEFLVYSAFSHAQKHGLSAVEIIQQILGDAAVQGSDQSLLSPLSITSQPTVDRGLLRTISLGGPESIVDIEVFPDYVATLNRGGSIHFWSYNGVWIDQLQIASEESERGNDHFRGLRKIGNLLLRWDATGQIEFFDFRGVKIEDHRSEPLPSALSGMLILDELLVAWGGSCLQFWTKTGKWVASSGAEDHSKPILGVLSLDGRVVSFERGGAICCWGVDGVRVSGGDRRPHEDGLCGLIKCDDRLLSWGRFGSVRSWSLSGEPSGFPAFRLPLYVESKVIFIEGHLLFWDKYLRLCSSDIDGRDLSTIDGEAFNRSAITRVGEMLIDWGNEGAVIRSIDGKEPMPKLRSRAHTAGVLVANTHAVTWGSSHYEVWKRGVTLVRGRAVYFGHGKGQYGNLVGARVTQSKLITWTTDGLQFWNLESGVDSQLSWIDGIVAAPDRFVSWGNDGSVKFWTLSGKRLPGGHDAAHPDPVVCAVALRDRVVTWSEANGQRIWTLDGTPLSESEEGVSDDYRTMVDEVERVGNGAVTKGATGICFWDEKGTKTNQLDCEHMGSTNGFVVLGEHVVTWRGRSLEFWDQHGKRVKGGNDLAHDRRIAGGLPIGGHLLTWDKDGSIKLWSQGSESGREVISYDESLYAVISGLSYFVCWGVQKATFFSDDWKLIGEAELPMSDRYPDRQVRSPSGFLTLSSTFVSQHIDDGVIAFWKINDEGVEMKVAYHQDVSGLLDLGDRFVSWGLDGTLRFWSRSGEPLGKSIENAHGTFIRDVVLLDDVFVSLGGDGVVLIWRFNGTLMRIIAPPCGASSISVVDGRLLVCGLALWIYTREALGSKTTVH